MVSIYCFDFHLGATRMGMFGMTWRKMISSIHLTELNTFSKGPNSLKDALVSPSPLNDCYNLQLAHSTVSVGSFVTCISFAERLQQLHVSNNRQLIQEPNLHAKRKQLLEPIQQPRQLEETHGTKYYQEYDDEESQESQEEYEDEEKTSYTSSTTPHSRCSRGVSTDELEEQVPRKNPTTESTQHHTPPESTPSILSEKPRQSTNNSSKRFEDGDPVALESVPGRNSVLLQLISCGNLTVAKAKNNVPSLKQPAAAVTVNGPNANVVKRSVSDLHRGVLYKTAVKVAEEEMISYMSENPRFGNLQSEEKEYFSGSIIESMSENRVVDEPALKRSNSYNEERLVTSH